MLGLADDQALRFNISQANILSSAIELYDIVMEVKEIIGASKDLNATICALADNMTLYIRDQGYNSSAHYGVARKWVLHYRIR